MKASHRNAPPVSYGLSSLVKSGAKSGVMTSSVSPTKKMKMSKKDLQTMSKKIAAALSNNPESMDSFMQAQVNIKGKEVNLKEHLKIWINKSVSKRCAIQMNV